MQSLLSEAALYLDGSNIYAFSSHITLVCSYVACGTGENFHSTLIAPRKIDGQYQEPGSRITPRFSFRVFISHRAVRLNSG